jgi:anti-anti-sigma factor
MFTIDTDAGRLQLHCDLTIFQAGQLWPALSDALQQAPVQELDLNQVGEFDSAGVQLLLMLKRQAADQGRPLRLVKHSAAVTEVLNLINIAGLLGDPVVLPSQERRTGV